MSEKQPKFRSPPYPYITLEKALARADQLYAVVRHHSAAIPTVAKAWDIGAKSSATLQSIAALTQFDLLDQEGNGDARRVKLTPLALKILMDKRPVSADRDAAIRTAALSPKVFRELFDTYGRASDVNDDLLIHALTGERVQSGKAPYSEQSATDVLRIFRSTVEFAKLGSGQPVGDEPSDPQSPPPGEAKVLIGVGDYIQWLVRDSWQFAEPKRVRALSDDGVWVFVEGTETGIPAAQCEVIERGSAPRPEPIIASPPTRPLEIDPRRTMITPLVEKDDIKILLDAGRLEVTASVDINGLRRLQKRLAAFETILEEEEKEDASGEAGF